MKKALSFVILAFVMLATVPAHADLIGGHEKSDKLMAKASEPTVSAPFVDPQSILDYVAAFLGNAGTREGFYFDVNNEEFGNYLAATIYTIPDTGIAFSIGMLDLDGVGLTADYNVGAIIPSDSAPVLGMLNYLYIGGGVGYRNIDQEDGGQEWEVTPLLDAQFKFTF